MVKCICCGEGTTEKCPKSRKECGHHCNCTWIHDECCWCGREFGADDVEVENDFPIDLEADNE